jgi:hypothetical protein
MRVLIVEDEPYLAGAVRDGLRLEAIAADIAADGTTALELLSPTGSAWKAPTTSFENTGHPLPSELVATLTEPFQRGTERIRTDEHAGVGLGLAIVHSIVRAHDGTLDLTPRPAGGLIVTIRLPGTPQASTPSGPTRSLTGKVGTGRRGVATELPAVQREPPRV